MRESMTVSPEWRALAERVVAEYRAALGDDLVAVALFGSVARGDGMNTWPVFSVASARD
jgi:predicted nucleotidyltransferase